MSTLSGATPPEGTRRACMASVNTAGSREEAPYTALVDLSTNRFTDGARWHAASSCIVPMTLSSFIGVRRAGPARGGPVVLRPSGQVRPAGGGGTGPPPMPRPIDGSSGSSAASAPPSHRLTPVTSTTAGGTSVSSLLVATLDARLLQQLAVLLLGHPLAALLDDRTHGPAPDVVARGPAG